MIVSSENFQLCWYKLNESAARNEVKPKLTYVKSLGLIQGLKIRQEGTKLAHNRTLRIYSSFSSGPFAKLPGFDYFLKKASS